MNIIPHHIHLDLLLVSLGQILSSYLSPPSAHIVGGHGVVIVKEGAGERTITLKAGSELELTCIGKGVPTPLVSWVVKGRDFLTTGSQLAKKVFLTVPL